MKTTTSKNKKQVLLDAAKKVAAKSSGLSTDVLSQGLRIPPAKKQDRIILNKKAEKEAVLEKSKAAAKPIQIPPAESLTRLRVGDIFLDKGVEAVVWFANDCRAAIAPLNSLIHKRINNKGELQFLGGKEHSENISPNSDVKVIRSLGRQGLAEHIENRSKQITEQKSENMKTVKSKKKSEGTHGKLGGYKGHSVTSVIRAFGKAGWTLDEARAFFKREGIPASDNTIKIQIRRGAKGEQEGAPLGADLLKSIKPKLAAVKSDKPAGKSEKSSKSEKPAAKSEAPAAKKKDEPKKASKPAPPEDEEDEDEDEE